MAEIPAALARHQRTAWKPVMTDGDGEPTGSRVGGTPWLPDRESWPTCGSCDAPMALRPPRRPDKWGLTPFLDDLGGLPASRSR